MLTFDHEFWPTFFTTDTILPKMTTLAAPAALPPPPIFLNA